MNLECLLISFDSRGPIATTYGARDWNSWCAGKTTGEVLEILPMVFNLCKTAQDIALRQAFGMEISSDASKKLSNEILEAHHFLLLYNLPRMLNLPPTSSLFEIEKVLRNKTPRLLEISFSKDAFLGGVRGLAQQNEIGIMDILEARTRETSILKLGVEIEYDPSSEAVQVPTARGIYEVEAKLNGDKITLFSRSTPTDRLLKKSGAIEQFVAQLPNATREELEYGLIILDPCIPVKIEMDMANA